MPRPPSYRRLHRMRAPIAACIVKEWPAGADEYHEARPAKCSPAVPCSPRAFSRAGGVLRGDFSVFLRHACQGRQDARAYTHELANDTNHSFAQCRTAPANAEAVSKSESLVFSLVN